jgi:RimJ/RimL family protein N-acetyltransferase
MDEQRETIDEPGLSEQARNLPITTSRLVLRLPEPEDAKAFTEVANNMAIASQMSSLPHPYSEKNAESWIAETLANTDLRKISLVITLKDGAIAGAAGVRSNDNGEPEITYFLGEAHWGSGLATEAAQAIIDLVFSTLDMERIIGRCGAANRGSRRVLEKCGFQFSCTGMCDCSALNASVPSEEFVLERSVWMSLKRWGAR